MDVALIDYGAGNLRSVQNALNRLGTRTIVTNDLERIASADKVIFPGVGHADAAMKSLRKQGLDKVIPALRQPVLGICLGMQLLCSGSEEGEEPGLGIINQRVMQFVDTPRSLHMGWNETHSLRNSLFEGIQQGSHFYYVHGYYVPNGLYSIGQSDFGMEFCAALNRDNFYGVQFHPEKSGSVGAKLLSNFLNLNS